ncbi:uncharacterized protein [Nicotiana tomentosiformis]|uniref:uncharacterized protein n=1 Tax=Nicotiana tomentosiformis TaxID=4098 RepID=UPI00388CCAE6
MPTPRSAIPPSSTPVIPSHGIQSSSSPVISSSSSPGIPSYSTPNMPTSSSRPAKHYFMPSSESIHTQDPPNIGVDSPLTSPCIDSDSVTQLPIHAEDPPNVGRLDDLGRLIIVPDGAGFHPCTQATKVVV